MRTKDTYRIHLYDFLKFDILVVCPNCAKQAIVKSTHFSFAKIKEHDVRVVCPGCGFSKFLSEKSLSTLFSARDRIIKGRHFVIGTAVDPFFYFPVWLKAEHEGNVLWAYNLEHLNFIKRHVEAKLRERNVPGLNNRSLGSRLPKWMTSRKNREAVLQKILDLYKL